MIGLWETDPTLGLPKIIMQRFGRLALFRMSERVQHNRPTTVAMHDDCELTTGFKLIRLEIAEL
jgi:hypothetical protein